MKTSNIILTKTEFNDLKGRAEAYDRIISLAQKEISVTPPERNIKKIITEFKKTDQYSKDFLKSLELGLNRSTHFTK